MQRVDAWCLWVCEIGSWADEWRLGTGMGERLKLRGGEGAGRWDTEGERWI